MNRPIRLKSVEEILARLQELVRRYRRRYTQRNLRPCPYNCKHAKVIGRQIVGCLGCGSRNPEFCKDLSVFSPAFSKQELVDEFNRGLRDPQVLLREYRDLVAFLWVVGYFDRPEAVPEHIIQAKARGEEIAKGGNP
jgi:hypothetical protein